MNSSGFGTIIEIGDVLVSEDVVCEFFACDYAACGGACCVEGESGAPLEESELDSLEEGYGAYSGLMTAAGRERVSEVGFFEIDREGDLVTPCVRGGASEGPASGAGALAASGAALASGAGGSGESGTGAARGTAESGTGAASGAGGALEDSGAAESGACAFCHFGCFQQEEPRQKTPKTSDPPAKNVGGPSKSAENDRAVSALCAIEMAGREKPVSCALYPIRITKMPGGGLALNLHRWDICRAAFEKGRREGVRAYEFLRGPLERRFGAEFYEALSAAAQHIL